MDKAALFFDIDGTLLSNHTHKIPESTYRALEEARLRGHEIFINTGRTYCSISPSVLEIEFDGLLCGCGTHVFYKEKELFHSTLEEARGYEILEQMKACKVEGFIEAGDELYFPETSRFKEIEYVRKWYQADLKVGKKISKETKKFRYDKLFVFTDEESDVATFQKIIQPELVALDRQKGRYECIQNGYSKATAIEYIREMKGYEKDQIYIFGDSSNDLAMFEYATHAVAMKEHDPILDPYTEYVTDFVEEDGIYKALKHYKLI